jgi:hypothetical protein
MKLFIVILCIFATVAYSFDVDYKGNATLKNKDEFKYRHVKYTIWNNIDQSNGIAFTSTSVKKDKETEEQDLIEAVGYHMVGKAPTEFLAYFEKKSDYESTTKFPELNVSHATAFIADQVYSLEEVDKDSNVLQTINLEDLTWVASKKVNNKKGLFYVTYVGTTATPSNLTMSLTYIMSNRLGRIDYRDAIVTPKTVEKIVIIGGFPYQDKKEGRVRLNILVASKEDDTKETDNYKYMDSGDDEDKGLRLSDWKKHLSYSELKNEYLVNQLKELYGEEAKISHISVTFPKLASKMKLDTIIGSGEPPAVKGGKGGMPKGWLFTLIIVGIVLGVLVIALIAMFVFRQRRRRQYERI